MAGPDDTQPLPPHSGAFTFDDGPWPTDEDAGRYTFETLLGRGGMGEVWQAWDTHLRRTVAIKRARTDASPGLTARLMREARITASLDHPSIVPVHDAGTDEDGRPWYAMRVVRGRTLAEVLADTRDPEDRQGLLRHVLDACEAIAFAHHAGVVHRDLKPANIQLGAFGETQVMDWGLARPLEDEPSWDAVLSEVGTLTQVGVVLGTPAYMSPEQAAGGRGDPASDVWSLGVVLWEVIAGQRAYPGPSSHEILRKVLAGPPPPLTDVAPDAPAELAAIVARATDPDPAGRYPDAGALAADLQAFLDGRRVRAYRYTRSDALRRTARRWRVPLLAAAAGLAGLVIAGGVGLSALLDEQRRLRRVESDLQDALTTADTRLAEALTQRALLAFEGGDLGRAQLLAAQALTLGDDIDARGVLAAGEAHPRRVARIPVEGCRAAALADGALVCTDEDGLRRVDVDGQVRRLSQRTGPILRTQPWQPHLLVDGGDGFLYLDRADGGEVDAWRIETVDTHDRFGPSLVDGLFVNHHTTPNSQLLGPDPDAAGSLRPFDPCDGRAAHQLAVLDRDDLVAWCHDGSLRRGPPGALAPIDVIEGDATPDSIAIDAEGRTVAFGEITGQLRIFDLAGTSEPWVRRLGPARVEQVALSADGGWVAARVPGAGLFLFERATGRRHAIPSPARDVAFGRDERLRVWTGEALEVWDLPRPDAPGITRLGSAGVVGLSWTEQGLAIATGTGFDHIRLGGTAAARPLAEADQPPSLAVKGATVDARGRVWIATLDGLYRQGEALERVREGKFSRAVRLDDDHVLIAGRPTLLLRGDEVLLEEPWFQAVEAAASADRRTALLAERDHAMARLTLGPTPRWRRLEAQSATAIAADDDTGAWLGTDTGVDRLDADGTRTPFLRTGAWVTDLAVSPDGRLLAAADKEQRVWVVRTADGEPLARLRGHERRISALAFSPDGRWLASGSWDDTVRFWDLETLDAAAADLQGRIEEAWGVPVAELDIAR